MTLDYLKTILTYVPSSGVFRWRVKHSKKVVKGAVAGGRNVAGYTVIGIDGKTHYAHRLAWFYMTGDWPSQIDHKNGDRADNRWRNLRVATHQQNILNAKLAKSNTSGSKGVSWHKAAGKWSAYIILDGKKRHLGLHETPAEAHAEYMKAAKAAQPDFARAS